LNFEFKNEATRANLQENKRILKWQPFWSKVYKATLDFTIIECSRGEGIKPRNPLQGVTRTPPSFDSLGSLGPLPSSKELGVVFTFQELLRFSELLSYLPRMHFATKLVIVIITIIIIIIIIMIIIIIALLAHPIKMGLPIPMTIKCNINS